MEKYIFTNNGLLATPSMHSIGIRQGGFVFDTTIRLIVFDKKRLIYIRINSFDSLYQGLEYKKVEYQFNKNLKACEVYLKKNYKNYKIYDSLSLAKLPYQLQRDILNN